MIYYNLLSPPDVPQHKAPASKQDDTTTDTQSGTPTDTEIDADTDTNLHHNLS